MLEGWALLGAMAEATSRVRIGCMVTGNTYRHPAVLAKMAVTIDHLCGGRLEFGIGAAWAEIEHEMLGIEFGTAGRRVEWLDESCQVIKLLFTEQRTAFEGARYTLQRRDLEPEAGAAAVSAVLDRRARRAQDAARDRAARRRLERPRRRARRGRAPLRGSSTRHCADIGRDPAEIRRSVQIRYTGRRRAPPAQRRASSSTRNVRDLIVIVSPGQARAHAEAGAALVPRLHALD